jgi:glyoxylase-like metal-dependent hydrolase (beta-lactamase superfamily II)
MLGFELLVAGHCTQLERFTRRGGRWRPIEFPSSVGLIRHPDAGVLLFDTGYSPRFAEATSRLPYRLYSLLLPVTCTPWDAVRTQLADRGIAADEVRTVVLSHLHGDHVAGLRDFPAARIVVGQGELPRDWRTASAWTHAGHGFVPDLLPADLDARIGQPGAQVGTGLRDPFGQGHDLLGDGSVFTVPLPGHTAGHQGVWLPSVGPDGLLLVGDACWTERAFTHGELPPGFILRSGDEGHYRAVVDGLARLHRARPELIIVPSHCWPSIRRAQAAVRG